MSIREAIVSVCRRAKQALIEGVPGKNAKRVHISACYGWISRGVRGFKLEAVRIGGTTYTSLEALQRFGDRLTAEPSSCLDADAVTPRSRQRQIEQAAKAVQEELGL